MNSSTRYILLLQSLAMILILTTGCAIRSTTLNCDSTMSEKVWETFRAVYTIERVWPAGFSCTAIIRYCCSKSSFRAIAHFWGNPGETLSTIRLDLQTGTGTVIAYWHEDQKICTIFLPERQTAFICQDNQTMMTAFNAPIPFSLTNLAKLLIGDWRNIAALGYTTAKAVTLDGLPAFEYALCQPNNIKAQNLILTPQGQPLALVKIDPQPWHILFSDILETAALPPLPQKISITLYTSSQKEKKSTEETVLSIKSMKYQTTPWLEPNLALPIPPGTRLQLN